MLTDQNHQIKNPARTVRSCSDIGNLMCHTVLLGKIKPPLNPFSTPQTATINVFHAASNRAERAIRETPCCRTRLEAHAGGGSPGRTVSAGDQATFLLHKRLRHRNTRQFACDLLQFYVCLSSKAVPLFCAFGPLCDRPFRSAPLQARNLHL